MNPSATASSPRQSALPNHADHRPRRSRRHFTCRAIPNAPQGRIRRSRLHQSPLRALKTRLPEEPPHFSFGKSPALQGPLPPPVFIEIDKKNTPHGRHNQRRYQPRCGNPTSPTHKFVSTGKPESRSLRPQEPPLPLRQGVPLQSGRNCLLGKRFNVDVDADRTSSPPSKPPRMASPISPSPSSTRAT